MLLRVSSDAAGLETDMSIVMAEAHAGDGGVPAGGELRAFALATVDALGPDDPALTAARAALVAAVGEVGFANAAGVVAAFNAITRVADATGTELDDFSEQMAPVLLADLDLSGLGSAL
jgi:hypothetical protein